MPAPAFAELCARSNFSLLNGASHPAEIVSTAATHGYASIGFCDANTLAGIVQGHVAAEELGLPFAVGARLRLEDVAEFLAWPTDRASYGRLTALLSRGKMLAPKPQAPQHNCRGGGAGPPGRAEQAGREGSYSIYRIAEAR